MFLLIFESIGTSELILIGIIALIFLGPRKMPEIAKKMGKIMADFRNTTNEFKQTWEREVNFEEEARTIKEFGNVDDGSAKEDAQSIQSPGVTAPEIKEIDASVFSPTVDAGRTQPSDVTADEHGSEQVSVLGSDNSLTDKKDWL